MAHEKPGFQDTYVAAEDLSAAQFRIVKAGTPAQTMLRAAATTDVPIGVLQDNPANGRAGLVMQTGKTKVVAGAGLNPGQAVSTDAQGRAVAVTIGTDTTRYVVGYVVEGAANAGEIATITVNCLAPHRAS